MYDILQKDRDALRRTRNDLEKTVGGLQKQLAESEISRYRYGGTYAEACRRIEVYQKENQSLRDRLRRAEEQIGR
jgi:chromosome segregation ATPase